MAVAETDSSTVEGLLDELSSNINNVNSALQPLLEKALSATASKLPLLDKAKLYVHTVYAIESLLFSYLRLNNVDAKTHPVFKELARVRAYFEKIKSIEAAGPSSRLYKGAAGRFIKHALSGNEDYDRKRAQAKTLQEASAKKKFDELAERYGKDLRFASVGKRMKGAEDEGNVATSTDDQSQKSKKRKSLQSRSDQGETEKRSRSKTKSDLRRTKKKQSHAPKDAHQAFQSLINRSSEQGDSE